ncbi:type I phosphomannose isomerase catalytic subunit [[Mycoplasma] testudinis]|uniref:type I phosphomannose isomerase catalytic subunit n=1 Tax=[Mycoplasma] testudinis TaxID=33924 RepID=UPI000696B015|nr:type I phosphomannose isomerase catalytic subunit [[Mycoplasma] testudinis]
MDNMHPIILKFRPALLNHVWGGNRLKDLFQSHLDDQEPVGEAWVISGFEDIKHQSVCIGPSPYSGISLFEIYKKYPKLFNCPKSPYPHLIKFIDAHNDLSVQVHPDDKVALKKHHCFGKNEAWYVLSDLKDDSILYGHNAQSKRELEHLVLNKKWNDLLVQKPIKKDDFIYVPTGTVHALKKGNFVCEIQQSSDITYRLYDYDRLGLDKKPRQLHIEDSLEVITVPQNFENSQALAKHHNNYLIDNDFFKLIKLSQNNQSLNLEKTNWCEIIAISGSGKVNSLDFKFGDGAIVSTNHTELKISGTLELLVLVNS